MLVIEGPDMIGKTTLMSVLKNEIESLSRSIGLPVTCSTDHLGSEASTEQWGVGKYLTKVQPWHIQDRFHTGDLIYGHIFRGGTTGPILGPDEYMEIDDAIGDAGGMVIGCYASDKVYKAVADAHHARGEMYSLDGCLKVNKEYRRTFKNNNTYLSFDYLFETRIAKDGSFKYPGLNTVKVKQIAKQYISNQIDRLSWAAGWGSK